MGNGSVKGGEIEAEIKKDKALAVATVKLIMLGSGESGKSTLVRQMKILKLNGFSAEEQEFYREQIQKNLSESTTILQQSLQDLEIENQENVDEAFETSIPAVRSWYENCEKHHLEFADEIGEAIRTILKDKQIADLLSQTPEKFPRIPDSGSYFFENHARITKTDYTPSNDDIVRCRITTTGVHEIIFSLQRMTFRIIDVGGQRGQRKKWIHQFDNVQGMLFVTGLCDYYRTLAEDPTVNRMTDSIELFNNLISNPVFANTSVLIFFNKKDIFIDKLKIYPLSVCFPGVDISDYEQAKNYIQEKFLEGKPEGKTVYVHFTNATDIGNTEVVLKMTFDVIIKQNMRGTGIIV